MGGLRRQGPRYGNTFYNCKMTIGSFEGLVVRFSEGGACVRDRNVGRSFNICSYPSRLLGRRRRRVSTFGTFICERVKERLVGHGIEGVERQ